MSGVSAPALSGLTRSLRAAADQVADLEATNLEAAQTIAAAFRPVAPRRTGALAASVRASATPTQARVTVGVRYAVPVLFGAPRAGTRPARVTPVTIAQDTGRWLHVYEQHVADAAAAAVKGA